MIDLMILWERRNMWKMLIVDDEPMARKHIRSNFPWSRWEIKITGEAANGMEALAFCASSVPDIALIDITMPVMDGLTLMNRLKEDYPTVQCIILTAHRDFEYAQQAIQNGAVGYVLKSPVHIDEMETALKRAILNIQMTSTAEQFREEQTNLLQSFRYPIRLQFFEDILHGVVTDKHSILDYARSIGMELVADTYVMILIEGANLKTYETIARLPIDQISCRFELFPSSKNSCILLLKDLTNDISDVIDELLNALQHRKESNDYTLLVSNVFHSIKQLRDQYLHLIDLQKYRYYQRKNVPLLDKHLVPLHTFLPDMFDRLALQFQDVILTRDPAELDRWLKETEQHSLYYKPDPELLKQWFYYLPFKEKDSVWLTFDAMISLFDSLDQIQQWIITWWDQQELFVRTRPEIANAMDYVRNHLGEELSLDILAQQTKITPAYLGRLFKKEFGLSIVDFIAEERVRQAKRYIAEGTFRNHEIAQILGFNNYSYFSTLFKKITGLSPNEYKNSVKAIQLTTASPKKEGSL